jgi:hypothetical protein
VGNFNVQTMNYLKSSPNTPIGGKKFNYRATKNLLAILAGDFLFICCGSTSLPGGFILLKAWAFLSGRNWE